MRGREHRRAFVADALGALLLAGLVWAVVYGPSWWALVAGGQLR